MRDFRREQAQGREALAGPKLFLHVDDAGQQPSLLDGHGGKIAERGEDLHFVVGKTMALLGIDREHSDGLLRESQRHREHRNQLLLARDIGLDVALLPHHVDDGDRLVARHHAAQERILRAQVRLPAIEFRTAAAGAQDQFRAILAQEKNRAEPRLHQAERLDS